MVENLEALKKILVDKFGWSEFRQGQYEIISRLLDGKSCLAVFPTGGGKSLCYQLPALNFDGLTVVVSPLIALMKDQIDQLKQRGVEAVRLDSSLSFDEYRDAIQKVRDGRAKLLYVAPERFFNERFRGELQGIKISLFAIDEAHCISQWGHNFRPDYLKLFRISQELDVQRILCLTATATPAVQQDICQTFNIDQEDAICTDFFRPNLHIRSQIVSGSERDQLLVSQIQQSPRGPTIVYVTLQKTAENVAEVCRSFGLNAKHYHAGMNPEQRSEIQDWFMGSQCGIVVATIAFGMGIDKQDIRYVYHYNPPKSIENFAQEIGRAGRDGEVRFVNPCWCQKTGLCWKILCLATPRRCSQSRRWSTNWRISHPSFL
ncbi:MAG: RecQ family ATP-dependent DNA helicase [Planctomycetota bacterium]